MYRVIRCSIQLPEVTAVATDTINENDPVSEKAVDLKFFNSNHELIGQSAISAVDTNDAFLYDVEVYPSYRGEGYGNSIVQYCLDNYDVTTLTVEPSNSRAINLYKKFGFIIDEPFEENGIEYLVMKRSLT